MSLHDLACRTTASFLEEPSRLAGLVARLVVESCGEGRLVCFVRGFGHLPPSPLSRSSRLRFDHSEFLAEAHIRIQLMLFDHELERHTQG